MRRRDSQRGFSLVELIIVMALLSIVAGFAVPAYQSYARKTDLKSAARQISSEIFMLKAKSGSENVFYKVAFDTSAKTYSVEKGDSSGSTYTVESTKALADFGSDISFSGTTFSSDEVIFDPRGTCSQGSVTLVNSNSNQAVIAITMRGRTYVSYPQ